MHNTYAHKNHINIDKDLKYHLMIAISYIITPEAIFDSCLITKFPFCNYYYVNIYSIHVWLNLITMQTRSTNFMMQFAPTRNDNSTAFDSFKT